jgi:hypothetical protein
VNFAKQEADGIDIDLGYRKTFGNGSKLDLHGVATYVIKRNNFTDPINPTIPNRQLSELGDPQWAANFNAAYRLGRVGFTYSLNYVGKQTIGTYESQHSFDGKPPQNADQFPRIFYPDRLYHAVRFDLRSSANGKPDKIDFYVGVDNIFNSKPPLGLLGIGVEPFDAIGRVYYGGVTVDF